MKDFIWKTDRASIREETENSTERELAIKLRADVPHPSVVTLTELILVVIRVGEAAVNRQRGRQGYIREKSLVDKLPVDLGVEVGGLLGIDWDWREDGGGIDPNTAKF